MHVHPRPSAAFLLLVFLGVFASTGLFAASVPCAMNTADRSVTICSPVENGAVTSPVKIVAGATANHPVKGIQIFVDGVKVYQSTGSELNTPVKMSEGPHRVSVQAVDSMNVAFKSTIHVNVGPAAVGVNQIQHVIFFLQENRSFDSYFGRMGAYRTQHGYGGTFNGVPLNASLPDKSGTGHVSPFHYRTVCTEQISPSWNESHGDVDNNKMDHFLQTQGGSTIDPEQTRVMGYYDQTDLPFYYELATQYATSDTWYSPLLANTIPNRMYLFAGTSFGHIRPDNPPAGGWTHATIFRILAQHHISWRYYYQDNSIFLSSWSDWNTYKGSVYPIQQYFTDIQNPATAPQVMFIERGSNTGIDEHPTTNIQKGAASAANIINKFLQSPSYAKSVFILTYDEGGGLYDHVPPITEVAPDNIAPMLKAGDAPGNFTTSGFRLPVIVISPWTKPHYVSHVKRDFTAILKFIETRFGLPSLSARDAAQDNMLEFFNFTTPQIPTPPPMPIQPTSGVCNKNLEKAPGY